MHRAIPRHSFLWGPSTKEGANHCIEGAFYFSFGQKRSKLGTLLQTDAIEAEMKKKEKKILTVRSSL
jgi:hypothetical protein